MEDLPLIRRAAQISRRCKQKRQAWKDAVLRMPLDEDGFISIEIPPLRRRFGEFVVDRYAPGVVHDYAALLRRIETTEAAIAQRGPTPRLTSWLTIYCNMLPELTIRYTVAMRKRPTKSGVWRYRESA